MPAHSAKPGMMNELEDERERLLEQMEKTRKSGAKGLSGKKG